MAKKGLVEKSKRPPKFPTRIIRRCQVCGRPRAFIRYFALCRICFRQLALEGKLPGVQKSSW